jgi:hypothetical protein
VTEVGRRGEVILCTISSGGQAHRVFQQECSSGASALVRGQLTDRKRTGPLTSRTHNNPGRAVHSRTVFKNAPTGGMTYDQA